MSSIEEGNKKQEFDENQDRFSRALEGTGAVLDELLKNISKQIPGVIFQYRIYPDGRACFPFASEHIKDIFEVSPEEVKEDASKVMERLHPDDHDRVVQSLMICKESLDKWEAEYRVILPQKGKRWVRGVAQPERLEDGSILCHGYIFDITENKKRQFETERLKEQFELAVAGTNDGIWDWNVLTNELFLSKRWKEMLGYEDWEIKNEFDSFVSLIYDEDVPSVNDYVQRYLKGEIDKFTMEFRMVHKDGSLVWVLSKGEALRDEHGKPYRMAGSHSDITERKEIEGQLWENQIRLEMAMDAGEHGLWDWDLDTNKIYFSPRYYTMLGYEPGDFPMAIEAMQSLIHPEDRAVVPDIHDYLAKGKPYGVQFRLKCKDGTYKWISAKAKGYEKDSKRKPHRAVGIHVDIDQLKRKTEALKETHRLAKMGRWDYYHEHDYLQWSGGVFDIFEFHPKKFDATYQAFIERVHPDDHNKVEQAWKKSLDNHQAYDIEHRVLLEDGRVKWVKEHCYTEYDDQNRPQHSVGIMQDITELTEEREKAIKADHAKSEFLTNMSHELRTPLNGILGFSDILKNTPLIDEQREYVNIIQTSGKHLTDIITDILDFSRMEAGKFELHPTKTDLRPLINKIVSIVRYSAETKGLEFTANIGHSIPQTVEVDHSKLKQVLLNLLSNAVKFTDEGSVQLTVHLQERQNNKARILFKITDTGIGIKEKDQEKIFESFYQADMSTCKRVDGTGLGLTICKEMLEKMGVMLKFNSKYGKGSTFYFELWLPCEGEQKNDSDNEGFGKTAEYSPFKNKKVLIAEDNQVNMHYAQTALSLFSKELQVIKAKDGKEAYKLFLEHSPDLILMDIIMPKIDGYQATTMIRNRDQNIPIVAMTAKALDEDRERCFAFGMNDYITKPVTLDQLKETLKKNLL